ncbi:MAG: ABC transporter ATP-binding protein [Oscillospiraceae bacterium]|nr:ABC transporter ATP-binding protein [Oscillospiraceae bacterium]
MREHTLQVNHLQIAFRTGNGLVQAVRDISFRLEKGRTLAIVGESGSGKSVTSRAIMGLLAPNAVVEGGEILYKGKDLLKMSEKELCKLRGDKIAMIFQDPMSALDPIMPIGKQIAEAMVINGKLSPADAKNKALRLMEEVGIRNAKSRYGKYPFEFSGGMRQRIVIAIALAADPEILICDEPTTALDVTIQAQILELINKLKEERHLSVIFITHDLGVVANVADDIAVMYAGKIVERGTAEDIFYDPRHPYTWALLTAMPDLETTGKLQAIPGAPPNMLHPPAGDAFAPRNPYAMEIDFEEQPPMFEISPTHAAATWLLHPNAPKVALPKALAARIERMGQIGG